MPADVTGLRELVEAVREARALRKAGNCNCEPGRAPCFVCSQVVARESNVSIYLLSTPDVLAAVEAVVALGEARAKFDASIGDDAMFDASRAENHAAMRAVCGLADRLHAARKGE